MSASPPVLDQVLVRECLEFSRYLSSKGPGVSAKLEVKIAGNSFSFNIKTPPTEVQGRKKKRKAPSAVTGEEINEDDLVFLIPDPLDAAPLLPDPMDSGPLLLDPLDAALLLQDPLGVALLLLDPQDVTLLPQPFLLDPGLVALKGAREHRLLRLDSSSWTVKQGHRTVTLRYNPTMTSVLPPSYCQN